MEHPVLTRIRRESFSVLGWFEPLADDKAARHAKFVILIGNAGPDMFRRFERERNPQSDLMDDWTRSVVDELARDVDATAVYPFDKPHQPFLTWARLSGAGYVSPLGLNIHPTYGLWHAFRAALLFPVVFDLPRHASGAHPCESCAAKPCLTACPASAFDGTSYNVARCGTFLNTEAGQDCMTGGCQARLACPVGKNYLYAPQQIDFHMRAFRKARQESMA